MRIITRFLQARRRSKALKLMMKAPYAVRMEAQNNYTQDIMFNVLLEDCMGDLREEVFGHGKPALIHPDERVVKVIYPDQVSGGSIPVASSKRGKELRGEGAGIRNKLASLKNIMEETDTIAAFVAQALRKFNEMVGLFPDFGFYSTKDKVYFRMDGKNYEITIKEQELS